MSRLAITRRLMAPAAACALVLTGAALTGCGGDPEPTAVGTTTPSARADARPFAATSPWNTRIDTAPALSDSTVQLRLATRAAGVRATTSGTILASDVRPVSGGVLVNTQRWSTLVVQGGVTTKLRCRQLPCGATADRVPDALQIPANAKPDPRYEGWMTVIQGDDAWDLWRARRLANGSISYAYARHWSVSGDGTGEAGRSAVRGSGLPLFAGLIGQRELERGEIDHALAIALPSPAAGKTVAPASATNGRGAEGAVAEGARLRLRPGVRLPSRTAQGRELTRAQERARDAILVALRRYGAIVVDRSAAPSLYAQSGISADALLGDELSRLTIDDFQVVSATASPAPGGATQETTP